MKRIRISEHAAHDLDGIFDYWARRATLEVAAKLIRSIERRIHLLAKSPGIGRGSEEIGANGFVFPASQYLIYYKKELRFILIVRVLHGARDQGPALGSPNQ